MASKTERIGLIIIAPLLLVSYLFVVSNFISMPFGTRNVSRLKFICPPENGTHNCKGEYSGLEEKTIKDNSDPANPKDLKIFVLELSSEKIKGPKTLLEMFNLDESLLQQKVCLNSRIESQKGITKGNFENGVRFAVEQEDAKGNSLFDIRNFGQLIEDSTCLLLNKELPSNQKIEIPILFIADMYDLETTYDLNIQIALKLYYNNVAIIIYILVFIFFIEFIKAIISLITFINIKYSYDT